MLLDKNKIKIKERLAKLNFEKISLNVLIAFGVLFLFGVLFNFMNILPYWINLNVLFVLVIAGGVWFLVEKIKKIPEEERKKNPLVYVSQYLFLLGLIVIAVNQFLKRQIILDWMFEISVLVIAFGFLVFYAHRNRVEKEIEDEKTKEDEKEKKRKEDFSEKFPRINKIPVFRSIVKWMYKEGWGYSVALIAIVVLGFVLRIWNINEIPFWWDEILHLSSSHSVFQTFLPAFPSGEIYFRSLPITYYISLVGIFLPKNEFFLRTSLLILFPISIALINSFLKNSPKKLKIIAICLISFSPILIVISQELRYYILLFVLSLLWFNILVSDFKLKKKAISLIVIFLLGINNSLLFVAVSFLSLLLYIYYYQLSNFKRFIVKNKLKFIFIFSILLSFIIYKIRHILIEDYINFNNLFLFNFKFLKDLNPVLFIFICIFFISLLQNNERRYKIFYYPIFFLISFLILINTRFGYSLRYYNFLIGFLLIISAQQFFRYAKIFRGLFQKIILFLIIFLVILSPLLNYISEDSRLILKQDYTWARPDYYLWNKVIIENKDNFSNCIFISNSPHILNHYSSKKSSYTLRDDPSLDKNSLIDRYTNTPLLIDKKQLSKIESSEGCIIIFADYKKENVWGENLKEHISENYVLLNQSRQVFVYSKRT